MNSSLQWTVDLSSILSMFCTFISCRANLCLCPDCILGPWTLPMCMFGRILASHINTYCTTLFQNRYSYISGHSWKLAVIRSLITQQKHILSFCMTSNQNKRYSSTVAIYRSHLWNNHLIFATVVEGYPLPIGACRAVWVPGQDLHGFDAQLQRILSLHCTPYVRPGLVSKYIM